MQLQFSFFEFFFGYAVTVSNFQNYLVMQLQFFFLPELILHKYSVEGYEDALRLAICMRSNFECEKVPSVNWFREDHEDDEDSRRKRKQNPKDTAQVKRSEEK